MKANIRLTSGRIDNQSMRSVCLSVVIPSGLNGRQLARWKAKNETAICKAIETNATPCDIAVSLNDSDDTNIDGDTNKRVTPAYTETHDSNQLKLAPMKTTDQLTARELLTIFYDTVKVSQMSDSSYHQCLELLRAAPLDQPFTVSNKNDRWLLVYCLDYKAPMVEPKVSLFDTLADAIRAGLNFRG